MNLLPSHLAQSTLGERCALYLDSVFGDIPVTFNSLRQFANTLTQSSYPLRFLPRVLDPDQVSTASPVTLILTVLACVLAIAAMSWRSPFNNFWRRSTYSNVPAPQVSDNDFSYISPDDMVDSPSHGYDEQYTGTGDAEPDILLLKHRGITYPLHFPAYAIDDGALTVRELRQRAAEKMGTSNPNRIKLLYKGKPLKDDSQPCKTEGLKQQSEVLCVVSEVQPGESTPSDLSESDTERISDSARLDDGHAASANADNKKKSRKRKNKNRNKNKGADGLAGPNNLAPPMDQRPSSSGRSSDPSPAPSLKSFRNAREQVNALTNYFRTTLLPLCEAYVAHPPADAKSKDFEHKKLSETILAQVILKADGIEPDGDAEARSARRALIKEVQATLTQLDQTAKEQ